MRFSKIVIRKSLRQPFDGGFPFPAAMYSCRAWAYSSGVSVSFAAASFCRASLKYFFRYVTHQPQPVPAPPHSLIWLARRGCRTRMKLRIFRLGDVEAVADGVVELHRLTPGLDSHPAEKSNRWRTRSTPAAPSSRGAESIVRTHLRCVVKRVAPPHPLRLSPHVPRYSLFTTPITSGALVATRLCASHSIFLPGTSGSRAAQTARLPSRIVSVRRPA